MNILIKLMSIVSLVLAPTLAGMFHTRTVVNEDARDANGKIEMKKEVAPKPVAFSTAHY